MSAFPISSPVSCPRPEYPRPQFRRDDWLCLNGQWQFEIDSGDTGLDRGLQLRDLNGEITVPFCPESSLSGVGYLDFMHVVWYRRQVEIPDAWKNRKIVLHFGAVDYDATVWLVKGEAGNEKATEIGRHRGGFTPFTCDLLDLAKAGETVTFVLRARDPNRDSQPRGKQASQYAPYTCFYTRTTGIWQSVWLEPLPEISMKRARITPDVAGSSFHVAQPLSGGKRGLKFRAALKIGEEIVCEKTVRADLDLAPQIHLEIPAEKVRLWRLDDPFLYDLTLQLVDGANEDRVLDTVESYAGLRSISIHGQRVLLNGESVFQRLILDQGYYPDGVMTAPSDDALIQDIKMAQDAGFNGARLHQKIFEERFLYHADRLGYIVWGEFPDWGCSENGPQHNHLTPGVTYVTQWIESIERDYSHPSLVGWCGLNETLQVLSDGIRVLDDATRAMFLAAKGIDSTRPVLDASGYSHRVLETDIYDSHDYILQDDFAAGLEMFKRRHALEDDTLEDGTLEVGTREVDANFLLDSTGVRQRGMFVNGTPNKPISTPYRGQPYFVSEFGGFRWNPASKVDDSMVLSEDGTATVGAQRESWGYGASPQTIEEFYVRFQAVCDVLLDHPKMFGYCYTQLTDIFPEENGIYTYDRQSKFDNARLKAIQTRQAAIEKDIVK